MKRYERISQWLAHYSILSGWALFSLRVALGLTCAGDAAYTYLEVSEFLKEPQLFTPTSAAHAPLSPLDWLPPGAWTTSAFFLVSFLGVLFSLGVPGIRFVLPFGLAMIRHRVPVVETGGMAVLQLTLLCTWALPINTPCNVFDLLRHPHRKDWWSEQQRALDQFHVSPGFVLICLQLAINYGYNAYNKLTAPWTDGVAVERALGNPNMVHGLGVWVADLPTEILRLNNHAALFVEFLLPILLLVPFQRKKALLVAACLMTGLHAFIALTLTVGIFSYAMLCHVPLLALARYSRAPHLGRAQPPPVWRRRLALGFSAVFFYVMLWSLDVMWHASNLVPLPEPLVRISAWLRLRQGWGMFAHPIDRAFLTVTRATLADGRVFDPWRSLVAAKPDATPRDVVPRIAYKRHGAFNIDAQALESKEFREHFADWLLARAQAEYPNQKIVSLVGWTLEVPTEKKWRAPSADIDDSVQRFRVPSHGAIAFMVESTQVWAAQRLHDGWMVPEGTPVLTPVGASLSPGCAHVVLRLSEPRVVRSLLIQADSFDRYAIEGSTDGSEFFPLDEVERLPSRQYRTRVLSLEAPAPLRALRLYHAEPRTRIGYISEIALFDLPVTLPPLPEAPSDAHFIASYERPAAMGLFARPTRASGECPFTWTPPKPRVRKIIRNNQR